LVKQFLLPGQTGKKQAISRDHLTDLNDRGL
jgi:hypothetical protein